MMRVCGFSCVEQGERVVTRPPVQSCGTQQDCEMVRTSEKMRAQSLWLLYGFATFRFEEFPVMKKFETREAGILQPHPGSLDLTGLLVAQ